MIKQVHRASTFVTGKEAEYTDEFNYKNSEMVLHNLLF